MSACLARPHNPHGRASWFSHGPPPPPPPRPPGPGQMAPPGVKQPMTPPKAAPPKVFITPARVAYVPPIRPSLTAMSSQPVTPEEAFITSPEKKKDCLQRAFSQKHVYCNHHLGRIVQGLG